MLQKIIFMQYFQLKESTSVNERNEFILLCSKASCSIFDIFIIFPIVFDILDILKIIEFHNVFISIYQLTLTVCTLRTRVYYHMVT